MKENKYLAYLTGVYLSDGSCFKHERGYVFKLSSIDMDYINYTNKCIDNLINKTGSIYESKPTGWGKKNIFTIRIYEKQLFEYLTIQTEKKTKIPTWILEGKESIKKEFIAGMVDGDGWVVFNVSGTGRGLNWQIGLSGSEIMMNNISRMCNKMQLKSWGPTKIKTSKNTYRLFFDTLDFIKFKIKLRIDRKMARINFIRKILNDYMLVSKTNPKRIKEVLG